jgi:hypothetical protein
MTRYDDPTSSTAGGAARGDAGLEVNTAVVTPTDRIRWGPILAGTFAALTALAVLSVLGAAIGLSSYDPGDNPRSFAIGATIWGIITMILSFLLGGWIAARSSAVRGRDNGLLNGAMVAGFGIPLMLFLLGSAGTLLGHAEMQNPDNGGGGGASARASSGQNTPSPTGSFDNAMQASARVTGGGNNAAMDNAGSAGGSSGNDTGSSDRAQATRAGRRAAWGTLFALCLSIASAAIGGSMGARDPGDRRRMGRDRTATAT